MNRGDSTYLNNEYYKSMVAKEDYLMQCPNGRMALIGDEHGNPARGAIQ